MRRLAALLISAAALAGCSDRDRLNPFDPANPDTGGRPADFRALADDAFVKLLWSPTNTPGLRGYHLHRRAPGETSFTPVSGVLTADTGTFTDLSVANGVRYEYRLFFELDTGPGNAPASDYATPGTRRPWVSEFDGGTVARLTADGRYVSGRTGGFNSASDLALDRNTGVLWISDPFDGRVQVLESELGTFVDITGFTEPAGIALDLTDQTAWVCDPGAGSVRHYTRFGTAATPASISPLDTPIGAAFEQSNRLLWICERNGNHVRTFLSNGVPQWSLALPNPSRVAVDSTTREGWVTSFTAGKVYKVSAGGALLDSLTGLSGPIGVAVDPRRGRVWVCDALGHRLRAYGRDGTLQFTVGNLPEVREVAVDLPTGDAWATVPGDGRVVRVSGAGQILEQTRGLATPIAIVIDPGR